MAEGMNIFANPALVQQVVQEEQRKKDLQESQQNILTQIGFNARQNAGNVANPLANVLGLPQQVDPRVEQAKQIQEAAKGVDREGPEGQLEFARKLESMGFYAEADMVRQKIVDNLNKSAIAQAQLANSQKPGAMKVTEVGAPNGMRQKVLLDANGNEVRKLGEPYKPGSAASVTVDNSGIAEYLSKTDGEKLRARIQRRHNMMENINSTLESVYKSPGAVSALGGIRENLGGIAGIAGLSGLEEKLSPQELVQARTKLKAMGLEIAKAIVDEPRITESERQIAENIQRGLEVTGSYKQTVEALKTLYEMTARQQKYDLDLKTGEFPYEDYAVPDVAEEKKGPAKIKTDADYDNLPSGAEFLDPNGVLRRKP